MWLGCVPTLSVPPTPSCPSPPHPQHLTRPLTTTQVWHSPAAIWNDDTCPPSSTEPSLAISPAIPPLLVVSPCPSSPLLLLPQHRALPELSTTQVCCAPTATLSARLTDRTAAALLLSRSAPSSTPSCPAAPCPKQTKPPSPLTAQVWCAPTAALVHPLALPTEANRDPAPAPKCRVAAGPAQASRLPRRKHRSPAPAARRER
mmetsp:Transcript_41043/g.92608  ORF Transcript_41043/g.92608 Transcript_41043/m.92608 type:complete len:203 (+) Transcript_41043:337-945(+)